MYIPEHFDEPNIETMQTLIRDQPLATLVTMSADGFDANHIPLHLGVDGCSSPYGRLSGHVARANPLWRNADQSKEVLAIFQSANAYISPSWYATKRESGKVVPTWNYTAVHVYGKLRVIDDSAWLHRLLVEMTQVFESCFSEPWTLANAPPDFIERLIGQIVGIEIDISRMQGKWKVSQNQPIENQRSVIAGLKSCGQPQAEAIAALVAAKIA